MFSGWKTIIILPNVGNELYTLAETTTLRVPRRTRERLELLDALLESANGSALW